MTSQGTNSEKNVNDSSGNPSFIQRLVGTGSGSQETSSKGANTSELNETPPDSSFAAKAQQGISSAFYGAKGHNSSNVTGHYKKVSSGTHDQTNTEGNVIDPNDNANVKYSSMVDSVITPEDVAAAKLTSKSNKAKTSGTGSSERTGAGTSNVETEPIEDYSRDSKSGVPAAGQAVGAQNAMKDSADHPEPQGARVDTARADIPKTSQKHYSEGVGDDYGSQNTTRNAAGGGIIGGIIGVVTGRSSQSDSATEASSTYSSQGKTAGTGTGVRSGDTTARSGDYAFDKQAAGAGDYDSHNKTTSGSNEYASDSKTGGSNEYGSDNKTSGTNKTNTLGYAAQGGVLGGIIGAVTGGSSSSTGTGTGTESDTTTRSGNIASDKQAAGAAGAAGTAGYDSDCKTTSGSNEYASGNKTTGDSNEYASGNKTTGDSNEYASESKTNATNKTNTLGYAAQGGVLGGIIGAVTGSSSSSTPSKGQVSETGFSNDADRTVDANEYAHEGESVVPGSFPSLNTNAKSKLDPGSVQTVGRDSQSESTANTSSDHTARNTAGGGILGGIIGAVTGRDSGAYSGSNTDSTELYSSGEGRYAQNAGPTPGATTTTDSSNRNAYDSSTVDSNASVGSLKGSSGVTGHSGGHAAGGAALGAGAGAGAGAAFASRGGQGGEHQTQQYGEGTGSQSKTSTGSANSSTKSQEEEILKLDREIETIELRIQKIESELGQQREGVQSQINAKEHQFSDSHYGGGAGLVEERKAVDSQDTKAYGANEKNLKSIRNKQNVATDKLSRLEQERQAIVARSQEIDSELAKIQKSVSLQLREIETGSLKNHSLFTESDNSRTLKNGPVSSKAVTNKRQLEIELLEDRLGRLRLQTQNLDNKIKAGETGETGDYNERSTTSHGHSGALAGAGLGAGAGAGAAYAATNKSSDDKNYQSIRAGHGSTVPGSGTQGSSGKNDAAIAAATASAGHRGSNLESGAPHSTQGIQSHRSIHDPENSVYPEHEKRPEEELVTGSGTAAKNSRQPYGTADKSGRTGGTTTQKSRSGTSGRDADVVAAGESNTSTGYTGAGVGTANSGNDELYGSSPRQKSSKQIDSDKAGSKTQQLLGKIPGINKKKAAGAGAAVAAGSVAANAVLGGDSKESATEKGKLAGAQHAQKNQQGHSVQSDQQGAGSNFDQKKFGDSAGKGLESAGVDKQYAGYGGTAAGLGLGYALTKYGQGGSGAGSGQGVEQSNYTGGHESSTYGSGQKAPSQTTGYRQDHSSGQSGQNATGYGQDHSSGQSGQNTTTNSSGPGSSFDHKKFGVTAGKGLESAGIDKQYAGYGGAAAGLGLGYALSKYGQGKTGSGEASGYGGANQSGYPQDANLTGYGSAPTAGGYDSNQSTGPTTGGYGSQTTGGHGSHQATGGHGSQTGDHSSQNAGAYGSQTGQSSSDRSNYANTKSSSGNLKQNPDLQGAKAQQFAEKIPGIDKTKAAGVGALVAAGGAAALGVASGRHQNRAGPSGAPYNSNYTDHERSDHSGISSHGVGPAGAPTDHSYTIGEGNDYSKTAATDSTNNSGRSHPSLHHTAAASTHQNRSGPSGAPYDSSYTDHERSDPSGITSAGVGPAGAPRDHSYATGEGNDYSKTAATDSANNVGKHQASLYPTGESVSKNTGGAGPGVIGGVGTAAAVGAASSGNSKSGGSSPSSPSLKNKILKAFKLGGSKKEEGQLHGTTYDDPNYNLNAYRQRGDQTYNTGDENLGDDQHPNSRRLGGDSGVLGAGIASSQERDRYRAAQGEKEGVSGTKGSQSDYYNASHANDRAGHGTATKQDPRTGKEVTGSATQAENLNREAALGTGAAGASANHRNQDQLPQTRNVPGAAVGGTEKDGSGDYLDIKVVGAHDKTEAAAIAAAVVKENRQSKGTFTESQVVVDADEFKLTHGNFIERFNDNDKAIVQQMEHAANQTTAHGLSH